MLDRAGDRVSRRRRLRRELPTDCKYSQRYVKGISFGVAKFSVLRHAVVASVIRFTVRLYQ